MFFQHGTSDPLHLRHGWAVVGTFWTVHQPAHSAEPVQQCSAMQDTESFYTIVQQKILERFGKQFTWELKAKMMGQKALPAAQTMVAELGLEGKLQPADFVKEREEMLHTMFPEAKLLPGVEQLINHLQENHVRLHKTVNGVQICSTSAG